MVKGINKAVNPLRNTRVITTSTGNGTQSSISIETVLNTIQSAIIIIKINKVINDKL